MIHVAASCNPCFHGTGAHYLNADTSVFMQMLQGDLFKDFPTLRLVIPHGGGAVPYHWGRYRGMSLEIAMERPLEGLLDNVFFDTCVYHQPGVELLTKVVPAEQRAVRLRNDRRRARQGPGHRRVLRRHQALHRRLPALSDADRYKPSSRAMRAASIRAWTNF
jgi:4-oxalmesaconate hydratase